jgi:hypothetical protein
MISRYGIVLMATLTQWLGLEVRRRYTTPHKRVTTQPRGFVLVVLWTAL